MNYIVATIDLDSSHDPSYEKLDELLSTHGLFSPQPKAYGSFPRNTYFGQLPSRITVRQHASDVFNSVKNAGLHPTKLMLAETTKDSVVTVTN